MKANGYEIKERLFSSVYWNNINKGFVSRASVQSDLSFHTPSGLPSCDVINGRMCSVEQRLSRSVIDINLKKCFSATE